jgi:hypothetical protein
MAAPRDTLTEPEHGTDLDVDCADHHLGCREGPDRSGVEAMAVLTSLATIATGVVASGAALVGVHAGDGPVDTSTSSSSALPCGAARDALPEALQKDLAALRDLAPAQRRSEAREIRRKALAGEYGDRAQSVAERRAGHRGEVWKRLPRELRRDLREVRSTAPEERAAAREEVRANALAGEYGARVRTAAERIQERRATCHPDSAG